MAPTHANEDGITVQRPVRAFWTVHDDAILIRGWLQTSKKTSGTDWEGISAFVSDKVHDIGRSPQSCKNRWNIISRSVTKYIAAMARAHQKAAGDTPESEVVAAANQIYVNDVKAKFSLQNAYELLRSEPKFINCIAANRKEIFGFLEEECSSEAEAGCKRPRLNERGSHLSSSDPDILINGEKVQEKGDDGFKDPESFKERILGSLKVIQETNHKVDEWKEVKLKEMQVSREIEELKLKKMEEKNRNIKLKILDTLLRKDSLSEFDADLKKRLCAELFPNNNVD